MGGPVAVGSLPRRYDCAGNLPRRTGAGTSHPIDGEVFLGKVLAVGPSRQSGHQLPPDVNKSLAGAAVAVGRVPHGF